MDTDSLIPFIKTEDSYEDIADDVEKRFDASDYKVDRPQPKGKNKKSDRINERQLKRIITEFVALRPKTYAYQIDDYDDYDDSRVKKAKGTKKCVIKRMLKLNDYRNCLLNDKVV